MTVWLTGFMAAGKSAVGRRLARRTGLPFVDLDREIVDADGRSISTIFEEGGEAEFRALEREALRRVAAGRPAIAATGGGVVGDPENRRVMRASGLVVWLDPALDLIFERLRRAPPGKRPLAGDDEAVRKLYESRLEAYGDCHQRVRIREGDSIAEVARRVAEAMRRHGCAT